MCTLPGAGKAMKPQKQLIPAQAIAPSGERPGANIKSSGVDTEAVTPVSVIPGTPDTSANVSLGEKKKRKNIVGLDL